MDYVKTYTMFVACFLTYFGQAKTGFIYINHHYIRRLTEKRIDLCYSVNRGIYGTHGRDTGWGQAPSIFIGDIAPMNILVYICQFHVTDECTIIFLGTEEYKLLYSSCYIPSVFRRLTEEFNKNFSVL
jgi:hypothetical protein